MSHPRSMDEAEPEMDAAETPVAEPWVERAPVPHTGRRGFLPIRTNLFDRVFIAVVVFVAIHLLWMRFVEAYLPLWVATVLSVLLGFWIVVRG